MNKKSSLIAERKLSEDCCHGEKAEYLLEKTPVDQ